MAVRRPEGRPGGTGDAGINNLGTLSLDHVRVLNNDTTYGGIVNWHDLTIENGTIENNASTSWFGGGLTSIGGTVSIRKTTLLNNEGHNGGGVASFSADVEISDSSLSSNSAFIGGGVMNNAGVLDISRSTFTSNHADAIGGGWASYNFATTTTEATAYAANSTNDGTYEDCFDDSGTHDCGQ